MLKKKKKSKSQGHGVNAAFQKFSPRYYKIVCVSSSDIQIDYLNYKVGKDLKEYVPS